MTTEILRSTSTQSMKDQIKESLAREQLANEPNIPELEKILMEASKLCIVKLLDAGADGCMMIAERESGVMIVGALSLKATNRLIKNLLKSLPVKHRVKALIDLTDLIDAL